METAGTWKNRVFAAGKGVLLSWIVTGILLALLSLALWKLDLDEGKVTIGIQAVYMLSAFAGGMMTGKKAQSPDRFYPSSKLCSCCGNIKKDLKLSDRIYKCDCGNVIDRDFQASINLKAYGERVAS